MRIPVGTAIRYRVRFRNPDGVLADPTTVTFRIKNPNAVEVLLTHGTDVALQKEAVGIYSTVFIHTISGDHTARFKGTGVVDVASRDHVVSVSATALTP